MRCTSSEQVVVCSLQGDVGSSESPISSWISASVQV